MSSFRDKMKKKRAGLKNRHNKKSSGGSRFPTIFKKNKIPEGVNFFKCGEGTHKVDILPWVVGKNMPLDESGNHMTEKGDFDYILDVWVHTNVGSMKQPYVCPHENFGKPCPICEYINNGPRLPKKEWVKVSPKRRSIYLLWDRTDREQEKKGIQIFDAAHFFMEEKLKEIAERPEEGGYIFFSDIGSKKSPGRHVVWKRKGTGQENTSYLGHRFIKRKTKLPDRILDKTFSLDKVVNMHPKYDEIAEAFASQILPKKEEDEPFNEDEEKEDIDESNWGVKKKKKKKKKSSKSSKKKASSKDKKKKKKGKR